MSFDEIKKIQEAALATITALEESAAKEIQELFDNSLTWAFLGSEPGFDTIYEFAGGSLQPMIDRLGIYPFVPQGEVGADYRLFAAQYKVLTGSEATLKINFIGGFQVQVILMLVMIGEYSSLIDDIVVMACEGEKVAPKPEPLFYWPDQDKDRVLLNKTGIRRKDEDDGVRSQFFNKTDAWGKVSKHWWFYVEYTVAKVENMRFPIPGEFTGLGVQLFPGYPWGKNQSLQKSSPFLYSGNWIDTVYYTSARVIEVIDPGEDEPYSTYKVRWRKHEVLARPSDFAEYRVDDRVTILKDVSTEKTEQTWKDEDADSETPETFDTDIWVIVPVTFYTEIEEAAR